MFTEFLRIKPILDGAAAKQMEASLSSRFARISKRFSAGLRSALRLVGVSLGIGLVQKLLNPLEAVEERIKNLLGQGKDLGDMSERFGTTTGKMFRLQTLASSFGIKPDELKEKLTKYAESVETAQKELKNPFEKRTEATQTLLNIFGKEQLQSQQDLVEGFFKFLQRLRTEGQAAPRTVYAQPGGFVASENVSASERQAGLARQMTGIEVRQYLEDLILGGKLVGGSRTLVEANLPEAMAKLKIPSEKQLTGAATVLQSRGSEQSRAQAEAEARNFIRDAGSPTTKMIADMEAQRQKDSDKLNRQLKSYDAIAAQSAQIKKLTDLVETEVMPTLMDYTARSVEGWSLIINAFKGSRLFRLFSGGP